MRRNTARCPPRRASSRSNGSCEADALTIHWHETGGPGGARADGDRLRHADHHRQHRAAARRQGEVRVGGRPGCAAPSRFRAANGPRAATGGKRGSAPRARRSVRCGAARHDRRGRSAGRAGAGGSAGRNRVCRWSARAAASPRRRRRCSRTSSTRRSSTSIWAGSWSIRSRTCSRSAGVPFMFVTGYGPESIDRRFAHSPILEKPVEREVLEEMLGRGSDDTAVRSVATA